MKRIIFVIIPFILVSCTSIQVNNAKVDLNKLMSIAEKEAEKEGLKKGFKKPELRHIEIEHKNKVFIGIKFSYIYLDSKKEKKGISVEYQGCSINMDLNGCNIKCESYRSLAWPAMEYKSYESYPGLPDFEKSEDIEISDAQKNLISALEKQTDECKAAIKKRDYKKVIEICEKSLDLVIAFINNRKGPLKISNKTKELVEQFEKWRKAAKEGIVQREALKAFQALDIKIDMMVINDNGEESVIINGKRYGKGDKYKGAEIVKIKYNRVDVVFTYKNRRYMYSIDFPVIEKK